MIAIISTTLSSKKDALHLGRALLDQKLIVCSNINKVTSQYNWNGKYHEEEEYHVNFKTSLGKKKAAVKFLKKNHPYEIPLITSEVKEINNSYDRWMEHVLH